ncbi:hypothetical protein LCGC14_2702650 [marine sediment metagenome]|uniref:Uncharacterized protein n=1 Tax=marine sediment metagenome TaxID=412755 RepID=A0A0F9A2X0_9ZZZZ
MDKIREEFEEPIYNVIDMQKAIQTGVKSRDPEIAELHESCNNYKKMYVDKTEEIKKLEIQIEHLTTCLSKAYKEYR